jgi:hypothetical protein
MSCGYSRVQSGGRVPTERVAPKANSVSAPPVLEALKLVPPWAWLLGVGCLTILLACTWLTLVLPQNSLERAVVSTALIGFGLVGLIAAEVWAFPMIALEAHHLGVMDFIVSFRFWTFVMKRLPRTRYPVCLLSWGLTAMLGAILVVGGLWYWLPGKHKTKFYLESPTVKTLPRESGKAQDEPINEKSEVIVTKANPSAADADDEDDKVAKDGQQPTTLRCVVLGYVPDEEGKLVGLVLGVAEKGGLRYAGLVRRGLNSTNQDQVRKRLSKLIRAKPSITALPDLRVPVIWVEPRLYCEVTQAGSGPSTTLPNPLFKALLDDPKGKK